MTNTPSGVDPLSTQASMFARLREADHVRREAAWREFRDRYGPVIAGFARKLGARPGDVDDVVQEVILAMIAVSPTFRYDRSKGRFRGYLKVVTLRFIRSIAGKRARLKSVPLDSIADESADLEHAWVAEWQRQLLARAMDELRDEYRAGRTFEAYEQYVLLDRPAQDVADEFGISVASVYQAKTRVTNALRRKVREWEREAPDGASN